MALLLQAALLIRHAPPAVADAFCATRLADGGGRLFGVLPQAPTSPASCRGSATIEPLREWDCG